MLPNQDGTAGTWNFQLHPAFWLGMALCDNQSAPEFTHAPCTPDSDTNIFDGTDPAGADYIGKHPGTAFLEVQFYPPGWAAVAARASAATPTKWCAAMAIFSLLPGPEHAASLNNADCLAPCRDRAGQLRLHHEERGPARAAGPLDADGRHVHARARRPICS